jgi:hypothetical protein
MTDPLDVTCPACLAAPGEQCYATSSDLPRRPAHRLRGLAAARSLRQCGGCHGVGWIADELDGDPRELPGAATTRDESNNQRNGHPSTHGG